MSLVISEYTVNTREQLESAIVAYENNVRKTMKKNSSKYREAFKLIAQGYERLENLDAEYKRSGSMSLPESPMVSDDEVDVAYNIMLEETLHKLMAEVVDEVDVAETVLEVPAYTGPERSSIFRVDILSYGTHNIAKFERVIDEFKQWSLSNFEEGSYYRIIDHNLLVEYNARLKMLRTAKDAYEQLDDQTCYDVPSTFVEPSTDITCYDWAHKPVLHLTPNSHFVPLLLYFLFKQVVVLTIADREIVVDSPKYQCYACPKQHENTRVRIISENGHVFKVCARGKFDDGDRFLSELGKVPEVVDEVVAEESVISESPVTTQEPQEPEEPAEEEVHSLF
jgi:hypothetical protein